MAAFLLRTSPRPSAPCRGARQQALMAYHTNSTSASGRAAGGQSSLLCSRKPTSQMAQDQLPPEMTEGRITLLYKGKGLDRALPASYRPITLLNKWHQARMPEWQGHIQPQILGLRQRACPRVCRQDTSLPLAHCNASSQACQTLSAPCGQPSGQQSMVMSTVAFATLSLVGQLPGIIARSSLSQMSQVLLASGEHQTHAPWMHRSQPRPAPVRDRRPPQPRRCSGPQAQMPLEMRPALTAAEDTSGAAGHPQPCHAQLPSLPGSLAVVWRRVDSSDPASSTSQICC